MTTRERFDTKWTENTTTGCHEWQAATDDDGYGRFSWNGTTGQAHRFVWEDERGAIPEGLVVRHVTCSYPGCVNVEHLDIGTQQDNMEDREADGNTPRGTRNGRSKLNPMQVRTIRRAMDWGARQCDVARLFKVDPTTVRDIMRGRIWSHIA